MVSVYSRRNSQGGGPYDFDYHPNEIRHKDNSAGVTDKQTGRLKIAGVRQGSAERIGLRAGFAESGLSKDSEFTYLIS